MKKKLSLFGVMIFLGMLWTPAFGQSVVTGLIVDAGHLSFNPTASPKILDEEGRQVYGSAYLEKQWVEKHGVVGYAKSIDEAKGNPRVAGSPYVVKAIRVTGPNNRDLVISGEEARKIREMSKHLNFLDQAKVMIVVP